MDFTEEKWSKPETATTDELHELMKQRIANELAAGQEIERHIREIIKSPEQLRHEEEYMFGPARKVRKPPKSPKTTRARKANKVARKQRKSN